MIAERMGQIERFGMVVLILQMRIRRRTGLATAAHKYYPWPFLAS